MSEQIFFDSHVGENPVGVNAKAHQRVEATQTDPPENFFIEDLELTYESDKFELENLSLDVGKLLEHASTKHVMPIRPLSLYDLFHSKPEFLIVNTPNGEMSILERLTNDAEASL